MPDPIRGPGDPSFVSREKKFSLAGTSLFVGLRAADTVLQYSIFRYGWGSALVSSLGGTAVTFASPTDSTLSNLSIGPYPALISALALGSSLKHIIWSVAIAETEMPPLSAVIVSMFNTIMNTANTLLSIWAATSQAPTLTTQDGTLYDTVVASPTLGVGLALFTVGIALELISEFQRKAFKDKPENKGKPYGGGLWSLATNINYGGYTIWRAGAALSAAGPVWGMFIGAFFFYDFSSRAVPSLDVYLTQKACLAVSLRIGNLHTNLYT